ncbi:MAG: Rv1355c family protein [Bacteroidota bacterium]
MTNISIANIYRPLFYRIAHPDQYAKYKQLTQIPSIRVFDTLKEQLKELIKLRNPQKKLSTEEYEQQLTNHLGNKTIEEYGVWVYFEWSQTLVHTLDEAEFIEVRTSRNQYKITKQERDLLSEKKIGVVGLSVGQSIALTLAIERVCGEIRLADFDTLELSNLNRIRSGIHNLGIPKVIIAAREIAEIDPFLKVTLFPEGLTDQNIDDFFGTKNGQLDLLVEVCDGLDIKIMSRYKARSLRIPVVMDTNDRGMVDIERFDLEPERPILHGLAGDLNPHSIKDLTNEQKIPYILKMVGAETISTRLKASMMEVEQTLNTWPQLASSVQLGGAATTDVCRRILLNQLKVSGRFYLDLDELIADEPVPAADTRDTDENPFLPLSEEQARTIGHRYFQHHPLTHQTTPPSETELNSIIDAAIAAPSAGNNQPWKWYYENGRLLLLHDRHRSWSWGDYAEMGSLMSLGAAIESVSLQALTYQYQTQVHYVHDEQEPFVAAAISFQPVDSKTDTSYDLSIAQYLFRRHTNRMAGTGTPVASEIITSISNEIDSVDGFTFSYIENKQTLKGLGEIIASCDRIRLLHEQGHEEFFHEVRWNRNQALQTKDGIELASVDLTESDKAGFSVAKDYNAIRYLNEWNLGSGFKKLSAKSMSTASGFGIVSIPEFNRSNLVKAGQSVLRAWVIANRQQVAFYPMLSPAFFFNRLIHGNGEGIPEPHKTELTQLLTQFQEYCPVSGAPVFMFRLALTDQETIKTVRMDKQTIFIR